MRFGRKWVCAAQPRMNFYRFGAFQTIPHPLRGSSLCTREPMSWCDFRLCAAEKTKAKIKVSNPKTAEKLKVAHSPSVAPRQLPPGGSLCLCDFRLCAAKKATAKSKFSKLKVCTLFFCGSAVFHHEPSSGRKVSRVERDGRSLRDGKWQKVAVFHICDFEFRSPFFQETVEI